jgi:hypothetical protein
MANDYPKGLMNRVDYGLDDDIIREIGEHAGFKLWSTRDKSLKYRDEGGDDIYDGLPVEGFAFPYISMYTPIPGRTMHLLTFVYKTYSYKQDLASAYTINIMTLKPTKNSLNQTLIPPHVIAKIKDKRREWENRDPTPFWLEKVK